MNITLEQVVSGNLSVIDSRDDSVFYDASSMGHTGAPLPSLEATATPTPEKTYTPEPRHTRHERPTALPTATQTPSGETSTIAVTPKPTPSTDIDGYMPPICNPAYTTCLGIQAPETGSGGYLSQNHGGNGTETAVILFALIAGTVANAAHGLYRHTVQSD